MGFIPIVCLDCGESVSRKSTTNPRIICTNCKTEYAMVRIKGVQK